MQIDVELANALERKLEIANQRGDREAAVKVKRQMASMIQQAEQAQEQSLTTREKLELQDARFMEENPDVDYQSDDFILRGLSDDQKKRVQSLESRVLPIPTPQNVYAPPEIQTNTSAAMSAGDLQERKIQTANLERLRNVNPWLAEVVEESGAYTQAGAGYIDGLRSLYRGVGGDTDKDVDFYLKQLTSNKPLASASKLVGQAAPFMIPGSQIPRISSTAGRSLAGGAVGAGEGNIIARGEGQDVATGTGLGLLLGAGGEALIPAFNRVGRRLAKSQGADINRAVQPDGTPTPEFQKVLDDSGMTMDDIAREAEKTENIASDMAAAAKKNKGLEDVIDSASPSAERVRAAESLNIDPESIPMPVMSDSQAVAEIGGGLAAVPGTQAGTQITDFADRLGMKADELIQEMGGTLDKKQASAELLRKMGTTRDDLYAAEGKAYDAVAEAVDPATKVNTRALVEKMENDARGLGGVEKLDGPTRRIYKIAKGKPTYGLLDRERKRIGAALHKKQGPYANTETSELSKLYGYLTQMQEGVAKEFGADTLWDAAKQQTIARKTLEEQTQTLFGKTLGDPMIPKLMDGLSKVSGKGSKKFNEIISAIPKEDRPAMIATALNGVFTAPNSVNKSFTATAFTKWMDELKRSPSTYSAVSKNLPEGAMKRLEALDSLAEGLARVQRVPKTGAVRSMFENFDKANGLVSKLYGSGKRIAGRITGLGDEGVSVLSEAVSMEKNSSVSAADKLISSPTFKRAFIETAKDPGGASSRKAQRVLKESKPYKDFLASRDQSAKSAIASAGLIPWLISDDNEEE